MIHLAAVVASVWIPLAADLTPANAAGNKQAPALIWELPQEVRYVLGDTHHNDPDLRQPCDQAGQELLTTRRGAYPHADSGVEVSRIQFHHAAGATHHDILSNQRQRTTQANGEVGTQAGAG